MKATLRWYHSVSPYDDITMHSIKYTEAIQEKGFLYSLDPDPDVDPRKN